MLFEFGQYIIDVDVEETRMCYQNQMLLTDGCCCDGCRNYLLAYELFPEKVKAFFENLGIDGRKPDEAYENCRECEGRQCFYGGFYFLCGTVIKGVSAWGNTTETVSGTVSSWEQNKAYEIEKGYYVSFDISDTELSDEFTRPTIIMDFAFHIPWILEDESNLQYK